MVLSIIGSMTLLVGPRFTFSEDTAVKQFSPFQKFIEKQRDDAIHHGKAAVLELYSSGKLLARSVEKDAKGKYMPLGEVETPLFSVESALSGKERTQILLLPDGTMDAFIIKLPKQKKQLLYNGTVARGKIL